MGRVYFGLNSPLRHKFHCPWSGRFRAWRVGGGAFGVGVLQACDLGFCGVSEVWTVGIPSIA